MKAANKDNADKMQSNHLTAENINHELRMYDWAAVVIIKVQHINLKTMSLRAQRQRGLSPSAAARHRLGSSPKVALFNSRVLTLVPPFLGQRSIKWTSLFSGAEKHQTLWVSDGDEVEFLWEGNHNVYRLKDKTAFDACKFVGSTPIARAFDTSGVRQVISSGDGMIHYFACRVGSHCSDGQKLAVTIVGTGDPDIKKANTKPTAPPTM